jgi:enoyl-[acyl-carrier protein] reductase I
LQRRLVNSSVEGFLTAMVRYLACELGPKRVRAASGVAHLDELLAEAELRAPERDLVDILDIGAATAFLCSPFAKPITGGTIYVDGGYNIRG